MNKWTVKISDTYCTWEYKIVGRDDTSLYKISQLIASYLNGEIVSEQLVEKRPEIDIAGNKLRRIRTILEE